MSSSGDAPAPACPACGTAADPGASTCSRCGAPLLTGTAAAADPPPHSASATPESGAATPQAPPPVQRPATATGATPPPADEPAVATGAAGQTAGDHASQYPTGQYPTGPYPPGPYQPGPYPPYPPYVSGKRVPAGVLGILLGSWGVHRFYLNDVLGGVLRILITIFTCGIGGVIGLIEGIIYLTKSDPEFDQIYLVERREWF